jgi:hypothetical protein
VPPSSSPGKRGNRKSGIGPKRTCPVTRAGVMRRLADQLDLRLAIASFASATRTDFALRGASISFLTVESKASPDGQRKAFFMFTA